MAPSLRRSPRLAKIPLEWSDIPPLPSRRHLNQVFQRYHNSLSDEDKEYQANLIMWCIVNSVPYSTNLFHKYKAAIEYMKNNGLM